MAPYSKHQPKKTAVVNIVGTLMYLSLILQWLWTTVVLGYPLLSGDMSFLYPTPAAQPAPTNPEPPSPIAIGLVVLMTVAVVVFTVYVLYKLPKAIGKNGARATQHISASLLPLVTHHTPNKKARRKLSYRLIVIVKLASILLPFLLLIFAGPLPNVDYRVIWVMGGFCAVGSIAYLGLQQLLVRIWRIPHEKVW